MRFHSTPSNGKHALEREIRSGRRSPGRLETERYFGGPCICGSRGTLVGAPRATRTYAAVVVVVVVVVVRTLFVRARQLRAL